MLTYLQYFLYAIAGFINKMAADVSDRIHKMVLISIYIFLNDTT